LPEAGVNKMLRSARLDYGGQAFAFSCQFTARMRHAGESCSDVILRSPSFFVRDASADQRRREIAVSLLLRRPSRRLRQGQRRPSRVPPPPGAKPAGVPTIARVQPLPGELSPANGASPLSRRPLTTPPFALIERAGRRLI